MTVICKVRDLEAGYEFSNRTDGNKKCTVTFRSSTKKLDIEEIFAGEGWINMNYLLEDQNIITDGSVSEVNRAWHFKPYIAKDSRAQYSATEFGRSGESLQVILGDVESTKLFPCSGYVRGDLTGTVRAPAIHARILGEDVWAFLLYFETDRPADSALKVGKKSLKVNLGSSAAIANLQVDDADKRKLSAKLNSTGTDFDKLKLFLFRTNISGFEQEQELGELGKDEGGFKELFWVPVNRSGAELLWVFPEKSHHHHGSLKDAIEQLGAKVNRSIFADAFQKKQMDDFILGDDERIKYKVELVMEDRFGSFVSDATSVRFAKLDFTEKHAKEVKKTMPEKISAGALVQPRSLKDASASVNNSESKFCRYCGFIIQLSAKYCTHCGKFQDGSLKSGQ